MINNKLLIVLFNTEADAFEGLKVLKTLHRHATLSLYETMTLVTEASGKAQVRHATHKGCFKTPLRLMTEIFSRVIRRKAGLMFDVTSNRSAEISIELSQFEIKTEFLGNVARYLVPGKSILLADINEPTPAPTDLRLWKLGGLTFRYVCAETRESQLLMAANELQIELLSLYSLLKSGDENEGAVILINIESAKQKLSVLQIELKTRRDYLQFEAVSKIKMMDDQMLHSDVQNKSEFAKEIDEIQTYYGARLDKLNEALEHSKHVLNRV